MNDSTLTGTGGVQPGPESFTVQDWIKVLHNGSQVAPTHPQYANVRQIMGEALSRIADLHMQQNEADSAAVVPPAMAAPLNLAQGASGGLGSFIGQAVPENLALLSRGAFGEKNPGSGTQEALALGRKFSPKSSIAGNVVGSAVPASLLGALGVPGPLAVGAPAGLQAGLETGSPGMGAAVGVGTAVGGKILGMGAKFIGLDKLASKAVGLLAKQFAAKTTTELAEKIGGASVEEIRAALTQQKFGTPEQIEQAIVGMRKGLERTASGGVTLTPKGEPLSTEPLLPKLRGQDPLDAPAFTRRGGAIPQTFNEIQERLTKARAAYGQHTAESVLPTSELPQPTGGATLTPRGGPKAVPADATPEPFQASRQIAGTIQQLQEKMGRELTRGERDAVLEKLLGKFNPRPGHPIFFGEGAPTPRGPVKE